MCHVCVIIYWFRFGSSSSSPPSPRIHASIFSSRVARRNAPQSSSPFAAEADVSPFFPRRLIVFFSFLPRDMSRSCRRTRRRTSAASSSPSAAASFAIGEGALERARRLGHHLLLFAHALRAHRASLSLARDGSIAHTLDARRARFRSRDGPSRRVRVARPLEVFALFPPRAPQLAVLEFADGYPHGDVAVARRGEKDRRVGFPVRLVRRGLAHRLEVTPALGAPVRGPVGAHHRSKVDVILGVKSAGGERARAATRATLRHARAAAAFARLLRRFLAARRVAGGIHQPTGRPGRRRVTRAIGR